jgi:peptidoglycan/LPS O-acetylase OafA/YrhL
MIRPGESDKLSLARLPSLDGWRAVAILLVLGAHSIWATGFPDHLKPAFELYFDGSLGVRLFFIISGFLITWLMLVEVDGTGTLSLKHFYIRRCLRIFPVYFAFVAVMAVLHFTAVSPQSGRSWFGILTFTRNTFGYDAISAHLWSLSVEEQFYALWPGLFILLGCGKNLRRILEVLLLLALFSIWVDGLNPLHGTFPNAFNLPLDFFYFVHCLAFGCAGAVLLAHKRDQLLACFKKYSALTTSLALVLIFLPGLLTRHHFGGLFLVKHGGNFQILGFTILILHSVIEPRFWLYRGLNLRPVRALGVLSYSLYIWQQLFWGAPSGLPFREYWWCGLWIIPLLATALLSYCGLERPLFKLRQKYHAPAK